MNWGIIGHQWAVDLLAEHIARGNERHAYLFTGPSGVGKRMLALRFTQGLNCVNPPAPGLPCQQCSTCKRIARMQYPDLSVVETEHEGEVLRIDQIRELQHTLSMSPYEGRYRVALVRRFEEANNGAANALLKTLEEPAVNVIVILLAKSPESLLPTIVSRCEVLRLRPPMADEIAAGLRVLKGVPEVQAEQLAHICGGRPGYAIRLLEQSALYEQRQNWLDDLLHILAASRRERFGLVRNLVEDKENLRNELQVWLAFWRDVLMKAAGTPQAVTNLDYSAQIDELAKTIAADRAKAHVSSVERTLEQLDNNVNARLALEVLVMDFPKAG